MKKYLFIIAAACVALVSCNKNETPVESLEVSTPVKMTLTATIGTDTKITYVDEGNVLKAEWEKYDKVSLLAVDGSGYLLSNDIFTAQNNGKTAEFEGTYTNNPNTAFVLVYYPALTTPDLIDGGYMSPVENGYSDQGVLYAFNDMYTHIRTAYFLQKENADPSHLCQYSVMAGEAEMDGNNFTVNLEHLSYVIKMTCQLPETGHMAKYLSIKSYDSNGSQGPQSWISHSGWGSYNTDLGLPVQGVSNITNFCFGNTVDNSGSGTGITLEGNTLTAYVVGYGSAEIAEGNYWNISLTTEYEDTDVDWSAKREFLSAKTLEPGNMYRLNLTLEQSL